MAYTTIDDPSAYFQVAQWTGNASTRSITLPGDTDMQPDMTLIKEYSSADENSWILQDSVRGASVFLTTNDLDADVSSSSVVTAFNSDGFSLGTAASVNKSGASCIGFCWKETADAGFDIVAFEGTGSARTISHSLSAVPHLMITKQREDPGGGSNSWNVYHHRNTSAPETDYLILEDSSATADSNIRWNDTAPTSSVFTVGTGNSVNQSGVDHIMYLWSGKQGFSKFGSYTGNANANGTFCYTGFAPKIIWYKITNGAGNWCMKVKGTTGFTGYNPEDKYLYTSARPGTSPVTGCTVDFLSNGFKWRDSAVNCNGSYSYIFMAWAEAPFVNSNGVPCNAT